MTPSILVLADLSAATERAAQYAAALGSPLHAELTLLHFYHDPVLELELAAVTVAQLDRNQADTATALRDVARRLPVPAGVTLSVAPMPAAVDEAVNRHHPLLLAMGLSTEHNQLDQVLHNQVLPVLRATHEPLLLVPEAGPAPRIPRRVLVAADGEPFTPTAAALALAPLLAAWQATFTVAHVKAHHALLASPGKMAQADLAASGLLPPGTALELYEECHVSAGAGVLQAIDDTQADLLVLLARPRTFLERRFRRSVTAQVLRHCRVPVLLVPVDAPELPAWMPTMS
ncbi:MAG: universal stress protein [Bacteroidota bacterium]|nr:universal stress protein [Bacteroidota bacterium]